MRNCNFGFLILWAFLASFTPGLAQSLKWNEEELPPAPLSRVLDPDNVYRGKPDVLARMSSYLQKLKADYNFDVYLVIYSGMIGKDVVRLSNRYHDAWLDEKNDGLVFVLDIQSVGGGYTGRSRKLYEGAFMEEGIMPRILLSEVDSLIRSAGSGMSEIDDIELKIEVFIKELTKRIGDLLELEATQNPGREKIHLMGVMAVGILLVGLLVALASKILGRSDKKSARLYRFPDLLVGERLGAPNGGGKVSWVDFGSPSGQ